MSITPGPIVLLGSGETSPSVRKVYDWLFSRLATPVQVAILETPAGFEPNSDYVAGQIGVYLTTRLQNYRPAVSVVPARKRNTPFSPDDPALLTPLDGADVILIGPGSPSYAVRQLQGSLAWQQVQANHRLGATLIFASASTIASSRTALPVYEIYKVGEELHWKAGLDFFGAYGLTLTFVPHWNNNDGGADLDTSHCYMGQARYDQLVDLLPDAHTETAAIVGIDENTALIIEPGAGQCRVMGPGGVTIIRAGQTHHFAGGSTFAATMLGPFHLPAGDSGLPQPVWEETQARRAAAYAKRQERPEPPAAVLALMAARAAARQEANWAEADSLRARIEEAGWQVMDTPNGPQAEPR